MFQGTRAFVLLLLVAAVVVMIALHNNSEGAGGAAELRDSSGRRLKSLTEIPDGFVPISTGTCNGMGTLVTLCKIDFSKHHRAPFKFPMFRDLVAASSCRGSNVITLTLGELASLLPHTLDPAGFVFHESRVGSTLVANLLASDPSNLVYSEAAPPANIVMQCPASASDKVHARERESVCVCVRVCVCVCARVRVYGLASEWMSG